MGAASRPTSASSTASGSARLRPPHRAVVDGDTKSAAIAAASIVAKVTRDRYMRTADAIYPAYGFASHVGYITPAHTRGRPRTRAVRDPPPLVPGALLPQRDELQPPPQERAVETRRARALRAGTACAATASSTRTRWLGGSELDLVARRGRTLVVLEVKSKSATASATRSRW